MSILQEVHASVALDHGKRVTCGARESALEWLCHKDGYVTVLQQGNSWLVVAIGYPNNGTNSDIRYLTETYRANGNTPAEAVAACAREAGWPG